MYVLYKGSRARKTILKFEKVKVRTNERAFLPQETLLLKRLVRSPVLKAQYVMIGPPVELKAIGELANCC